MIQSLGSGLRSWATLTVIWPLALWGMLWLNLSPGSANQVLNPDSLTSFAHGLRAISPFIAASFAAGIVAYQVIRQFPVRFDWINPLTFSVLYGTVGLFALVQSVDVSAALYWTVLYLSVPLVLLVISWQSDGLSQVVRVLNVTWLLMIAASLFLFVVALVELDLLDTLRKPSQLLECHSASWYEWSSGRLRATGVGRYAAVAALLALSGLWHRQWRGPWAIVFVISVTLLLFTGARGAFAGFFLGSFLVVLLHSGKKAVIVGVAATAILLPLFLVTGAHETFLDDCIFRNPPEQPQETVPKSENDLPETVAPAALSLNTPVPTSAPEPTAVASNPTVDSPIAPAPSPTVDSPIAPAPSPTTDSPIAPAPSPTADSPIAPAPRPTADSPIAPAPRPTTDSPIAPAPHPTAELRNTPQLKPANSNKAVTHSFTQFTGRTTRWSQGMELFKRSPIIGHGFYASRLVLNTHLHNGVVHSLVQTGILGTIAYLGAGLYGWFLLYRVSRNLVGLSVAHKHLVIQSGAVLAFLTMRAFPESTAAFFGVDWLLLAPVLIYLYLVDSRLFASERLST